MVDGRLALGYPPCSMTENSDRQQARLITWDDARGFGFAAVSGAEDVFVHVKALRSAHVRPVIGDELSFVVVAGRNGRPAARDVEIRGAPPPKLRVVTREPEARLTPLDLSRLLAAPWILLSAFLVVLLGRAPAWFGSLYLIMGTTSALLYWFDKNYARAGRSRVREVSMHLADAFFGIAGGLVAQHVFRHKTRKSGFRYVTRLIFVFHATLLAALLGGLVSFP